MQKRFIITIVILLSVCNIYANREHINKKEAERYFKEVKRLCDKDNGDAWGVNMYGPILFVDSKTRDVIANTGDNDGLLKKDGNVYIGKFPDNLPIANTATTWSGTKWTMVIWQSLSSNKIDRDNLIMHELWHRIQKDIGFPGAGTENGHLNQLNGRILLKMEWIALINAVKTDKEERKYHLSNALQFRNSRHNMFKDSRHNETIFEMHEGLAEHTGLSMCGASDSKQKKILTDRVDAALNRHTFMMSFAYMSGALYGYLLDDTDKPWHKELTSSSDFGALITKHYNVTPCNKDLNKLYAEYKAADMIDAENVYEKEMQAFLADCTKRFIDEAKLILPMNICRISFNPHTLVPFGEHGTIYKMLNAYGDWGTLQTNKGALVATDWSEIITDKPGADNKSENWTITLNPGWKIVKKPDGNYYVTKE
jgi:hypothetical protein